MIFEGGTFIADNPDAVFETVTDDPHITLRDCVFRGFRRVIVQSTSSAVQSFTAEGCTFGSCERVLYGKDATADYLHFISKDNLFSGCRGTEFQWPASPAGGEIIGNVHREGLNECYAFTNENRLLDWDIRDNRFEDYVNVRPGNDADAHYLRTYGNRVVIQNNYFGPLTVADGVSPNDTEGVRCKANVMELHDNQFIDAGFHEAMVSNKGVKTTYATNNTFEATPDNNAVAPSIGVLMSGSNYWHDNTFTGFNGCCFDTTGGWGSSGGQCVITGTNIIDSPCNDYSYSAAMIFRSSSGKQHTVTDTSIGGDVMPVRFAALHGGGQWNFSGGLLSTTKSPYYYRSNIDELIVRNDHSNQAADPIGRGKYSANYEHVEVEPLEILADI